MVEQRGEPFLLPCLCCLPYTVQPLGHTFPARRPARAWLDHVSLGLRPWLHPLRSRLPSLVRRLHRYCGGVRLLSSVHRRLWLLAFPTRTSPALRLAKREISRFPCKERLCMPGSQTSPGRMNARDCASSRMAFRPTDGVGTRFKFSIAAQWLAYTLPCRRFADILADTCARLGADADRYSFIAVDLHHLLLAGLPAHLLKNSTFGRRGNAASVKRKEDRWPRAL